jgi:hypothetical protein
VLPGEQQRMLRWEGDPHGQRLLLQGRQDGAQLLLEPGMQHRVGSREHPGGPHEAGGWAKAGEQFGGPATHVLVRLRFGVALEMPVFSRLRDGLVGAGFILAPQSNAGRFCLRVGQLDHGFFCVRLGVFDPHRPGLALA